MGKKYDYDYIIIGSGPAGTTAALTLATTHARIAIVEDSAFGGAHLNSRDIPYGVSLDFSHTFAKLSKHPGLVGQDISFDLSTVVTHQERISAETGGDNRNIFKDAGITTIDGFAHFLDPHTIAVGDRKYTAEIFILAAGAHLKADEVSGLETANYLTPSTAIKLRRLPKFVLVVGAGSTGCEIAEYFAELGTKVLLMERASRILPREDEEVSVVMTKYFTNELGMMISTNSRVVAIEQDGPVRKVIFSTDGQSKMIRTDCIVLATGSEPNTDYGLENAGVKYKKNGIPTNHLFQTTARNIYAIGDILGHESSTELSKYEGSLLANNLINRTRIIPNYSGFIRVVNTYPEIACVGYNEYDLMRRDQKYSKAIASFNELPASKIEGLNFGFVKIIAHPKTGQIIGATVVAPDAALIIQELAVAVRNQLTAANIADTPHIDNSFNAIVRLCASKLVVKRR